MPYAISCQQELQRILKRLGRGVRLFEDFAWEAARDGIIVQRGTHANFTQTANMRSVLLATDDRTLVEAG